MFIYKDEDKNFIYEKGQYIGIKFLRKRFKIIFYDFFIKIMLLFYNIKKVKEDKKYYISICSIFKNEAKYFEEWLEYHLMIGVDHFYLYNNFSEDNYYEILEKYIKSGVVTLIDWPVPQGQISAYMDCWQKNKLESKWICFLDLDEFICLYKELNLKIWLKKYENYPSVIAYWKIFGSSGKMVRKKRLVIEDFYISWKKVMNLGKVFCNTDYEMYQHKLHLITSIIKVFGLNIKIPSVNEFKKIVKWDIHRKKRNTNFSIQINHYAIKSYDEYIKNKMIRGDAFYKEYERKIEYFYNYESKSISCDYKLFRYLIKLKNRLEISE